MDHKRRPGAGGAATACTRSLVRARGRSVTYRRKANEPKQLHIRDDRGR